MERRKPCLELQKKSDDYSVVEFQPYSNFYRGRIYALRNEAIQQYAIIFDEEIHLLRGPPLHSQYLLDAGKYPPEDKDYVINKNLERAAKKQAKTLADKLKLPLKVVNKNKIPS